MTYQTRKLEDTAKRLGVSVTVLKQYLAHKSAEIKPRKASTRPTQTLRQRMHEGR